MTIRKLGTVVATAAMFASVMAPAAFADTVVVSGNGAGSDNDVHLSNDTSVTVSQSNTTVVSTSVTQNGDTGDNHANGNTGGDVTIKTGDVTNNAMVTVQGGSNKVTLPDACSCDTSTTIKVKNNGNKSDTDVHVHNKGGTSLGQASTTSVSTGLSQDAETGDNLANNNTGKKGNVKVKTGSVKNKVTVSVSSGNNTIK
jgi:hypothetical protein